MIIMKQLIAIIIVSLLTLMINDKQLMISKQFLTKIGGNNKF